MTLFLDASAIIGDEPERYALEAALEVDNARITSGLVWEAALAVSRGDDPEVGMNEVKRYCAELDIAIVPIGNREAEEAMRAHARYGKGTGHPAQLNMDDCLPMPAPRLTARNCSIKGTISSIRT